MKIIDNGDERNYLTDPANGYNGKISIELRGSTSLIYPKKQYGLETRNEDGSNNNVSLLGLPDENDWVLYAPYADKSLIRNVLAYRLSEELGHYAPRTRLCELVLNDLYQGVYVLTEKIKRDKNRVDISKLDPDDISGDDVTGGYIIKFDKITGSSTFSWATEIADIFTQVEYPGSEELAPEQAAYIRNYINRFEEALFSDLFTDPLYGYRQFIDLNSFLDYFIINELSKNIDAYRLSTFMFKDKESNNGKLTCGPVWDFNIAFGNADYRDGYTTDGLIALQHAWWDRLLQDTIFRNALKTRWREVRKGTLSNTRVLDMIDSLTSLLDESQERNFEKWNTLGKYVWPNYYRGLTYEDEIRFLKSWIINRMNWLDNHIPGNDAEYDPFVEFEATVFPNPCDYFFTFVFTLEEAGNVSLRLYDSGGRWIAELLHDAYYEKGKHKIVWNSFLHGNRVPGQLYILEFRINGRTVLKEKVIKK
ncbi:MAG: CotH kinase family protein [Bacteroidales bacterium]|nr:CotH kinase family protein [Bacteroidales bacterium]